jgi:hypothetical protein
MMQAYSQLMRLLGERNITVPALQKRVQQRGMPVNRKSLYRLNREHQPLAHLDLRVAGAVCQVCDVPLSELITFETPKRTLYRLSAAKQTQLAILVAKNNAGRLVGWRGRGAVGISTSSRRDGPGEHAHPGGTALATHDGLVPVRFVSPPSVSVQTSSPDLGLFSRLCR